LSQVHFPKQNSATPSDKTFSPRPPARMAFELDLADLIVIGNALRLLRWRV